MRLLELITSKRDGLLVVCTVVLWCALVGTATAEDGATVAGDTTSTVPAAEAPAPRADEASNEPPATSTPPAPAPTPAPTPTADSSHTSGGVTSTPPPTSEPTQPPAPVDPPPATTSPPSGDTPAPEPKALPHPPPTALAGVDTTTSTGVAVHPPIRTADAVRRPQRARPEVSRPAAASPRRATPTRHAAPAVSGWSDAVSRVAARARPETRSAAAPPPIKPAQARTDRAGGSSTPLAPQAPAPASAGAAAATGGSGSAGGVPAAILLTELALGTLALFTLLTLTPRLRSVTLASLLERPG
jgi:hypothetical protein